MTSQTRRERLQLGQLTLTVNAQGHRLRAEPAVRSRVAPTASMAAPQAHARSRVKRVRKAWGLIIAPNRIASLSLIAPLRESATRSPDPLATATTAGS